MLPGILGRDPETGKSLRIAAQQAAEEAAFEATAGDPAKIDDLADEVRTKLAEIEEELAKSGISISISQGARRRIKGGDDESAAKRPKVSKLEYLKSVSAKILEYATVELAPITPAAYAAAKGTLGLTQEIVIRVPVTLVTLTAAGVALSANFFKSLFAKFNTWARASATEIQSPDYADRAADAATKDLESIAKTTAVTAIFFNQLGLLPLEVVLAAVLYGLQVNLGTGPGRSLVVSHFYTWYIQKPKTAREAAKKGEISQEEIMQSAKQYTVAVAESLKAAGGKAKEVVSSKDVKDAAAGLAAKLKGFLPSTTAADNETQTIQAVLEKNGTPAAAAVLIKQGATNPDDLKNEVDTINVQLPKQSTIGKKPEASSSSSSSSAAASEESLVSEEEARQMPRRSTIGRYPLGPKASSSSSSSSAASASEESLVSEEEARQMPRRSTIGKPAAAAAAAAQQVRRSTRSSDAAAAAQAQQESDKVVLGKRGRSGGKRHTKRKAQLKRRRTVRRVPSGLFAY